LTISDECGFANYEDFLVAVAGSASRSANLVWAKASLDWFPANRASTSANSAQAPGHGTQTRDIETVDHLGWCVLDATNLMRREKMDRVRVCPDYGYGLPNERIQPSRMAPITGTSKSVVHAETYALGGNAISRRCEGGPRGPDQSGPIQLAKIQPAIYQIRGPHHAVPVHVGVAQREA